MKTIRASISGFGAVGQGVAEVLLKKQDYLKNVGLDIKIIAISDSKGSEINTDGIDLSSALARKREKGTVALEDKSSLEIIESVDHDLVIETTSTDINTGGIGLKNMLSAFNSGKDVVTSNKGPLALKYNELMEASRNSGSNFRFEATVGGAMPIINLIKDVLAGNDVISVEGILNGTCNYILTRMMEENAPYEQMLAESQELGIAETDPSYDVDGIDSACKLVILANSVFGMCLSYKDVDVTGITKITPESLLLAQNNGYVIKLIGEVKDNLIRVAPRLVPEDSPLAVGGTLNVASIQTDLSGTVTVTGRGAGSIETASAVLSDIVSIYRD
ncbi:Homoserine dehydrogenase [Methanohalobium evestigatum Z-7303]|uniref:Homoserine dehydrogenase n=1 Tax=Methanohalobium evestigatum (strain ATCC BAA-1072 / DSM 3721 / NBRC 107634 / OCM 161 / Z-7303) TaxID=644295 RepID=D7E8W7_METEZ|nr:homoserine dehydrogenase [Methanohalobium evestigatum]ADI73788.1 Homoserine dehydrogenase [Methanohalobium evestigatum Z-7303]